MLSPKRSKYRKAHKGRVHGLAKGGTTLNFGAYGLKASDAGRVTARGDHARVGGERGAVTAGPAQRGDDGPLADPA